MSRPGYLLSTGKYRKLSLSESVDRLCSLYGGYYHGKTSADELGDLLLIVVNRSTILNQAGIAPEDLVDIKLACVHMLLDHLTRKVANPVTLKGFLRTVIQRAMYRARSRQTVRRQREVPIDDEASNIDAQTSRNFREDDFPERAGLENCLDRLSDRERIVVNWTYVEQRKSSELAKMWLISNARVAQIKGGALKKLRRCLESLGILMRGMR